MHNYILIHEGKDSFFRKGARHAPAVVQHDDATSDSSDEDGLAFMDDEDTNEPAQPVLTKTNDKLMHQYF